MFRPTFIPAAKLSSFLLLFPVLSGAAQTSTPIGRTDAKEVQVSGAVKVDNGTMLLENGSAITAGTQSVDIRLTRGGLLRLCATTQVHLSHDSTIDAPDSTALMMALDRGAVEIDYDTGKYSDVLLTPDLRLLISGPGHASVNIRVNGRGDTCVDNRGASAPYITVTSQFDGGLYRLLPDQHVTFEHGSLRDVVDHETEPCGCPATAPVSVASGTSPSATPAGKPIGGPSSTPADTTFPIAISEGLAPPPAPPTTPVAKPGETHAQVTVPLVYNGDNPSPGASGPASSTTSPAPPAGSNANAPSAKATPSTRPAPSSTKSTELPHPSPEPAAAPAPTPPPPAGNPKPGPKKPNLLRRFGHLLNRIFGDNQAPTTNDAQS